MLLASDHYAGRSERFRTNVKILLSIRHPTVLSALLQGGAQGSIKANWGDGFSTNPTLFPAGSAGSPITFFTTLLTKPYV